MKPISLERRNLRRARVSWPVHARHAGVLLPRGTARDTCVAGMFIEFPGDARLPKPGSQLDLRVFLSGSGRYVDLNASVRWTGHSRLHDCPGIGVEYAIVAAVGVTPWAA